MIRPKKENESRCTHYVKIASFTFPLPEEPIRAAVCPAGIFNDKPSNTRAVFLVLKWERYTLEHETKVQDISY
jgi:hypothetical protein